MRIYVSELDVGFAFNTIPTGLLNEKPEIVQCKLYCIASELDDLPNGSQIIAAKQDEEPEILFNSPLPGGVADSIKEICKKIEEERSEKEKPFSDFESTWHIDANGEWLYLIAPNEEAAAKMAYDDSFRVGRFWQALGDYQQSQA